MSKLFETTEINGMSLPNRFVRSASYMQVATEDGACTPALIDLMTQMAEGGIGLIIAGTSYVRPDGQALPKMIGIYKDDFIKGYRQLTDEVHKYDSRIALQINFGGLLSPYALTGQAPLAPSIVEGFGWTPDREMTVEEIGDIVKAYGLAAGRARKAGFDAVQLHGAHGYLASQFLSPALNKRQDDYGGSLENRARFFLEVIREMRAAVGDDYPVMAKLNSEDFLPGGMTLEESIQVGSWLQEEGIDAIELSGGTVDCMPSINRNVSRAGITSEEKEAYFQNAAKTFKKVNSVPLMLVGGIRSFQVAAKLVDEGVADYFSMSRPFIREPGLIKRWASGDLSKAKCLSDNQCMTKNKPGEAIYCVVEKKMKEKKSD